MTYAIFSNMEMGNPPLRFFVGSFSWACPLASYYWMALLFISFLLILSKLKYDLKKIILEGLIAVGFCFFVVYLLTAMDAYKYGIMFANALGGLSDKEKTVYYSMFSYFFTLRTGMLVSAIILVLYERFSVLPFIEKWRNKK